MLTCEYDDLLLQYLICSQLWSWFFQILHEGGTHWSFSYSHIISLQSVFQCSFNFLIGYFIATSIMWNVQWDSVGTQFLNSTRSKVWTSVMIWKRCLITIMKIQFIFSAIARWQVCCALGCWTVAAGPRRPPLQPAPPPPPPTPRRPRRRRAGLSPPASSAVATPPPQ